MEPSAIVAEMRLSGLSLAGAAMRDVYDYLQKQEDPGDALTLLITALVAKNCAFLRFVCTCLALSLRLGASRFAAVQWSRSLWTLPQCAMRCRSCTQGAEVEQRPQRQTGAKLQMPVGLCT